MAETNDPHPDGEPAAQDVRDTNGRVVGWVSGLALLVVPWMVAGFVATAAAMVGPSGWEAERVFPWALLGAMALGIAWDVFGSLRISQFARGAIPGTGISLGVMGAVYLVSLALG